MRMNSHALLFSLFIISKTVFAAPSTVEYKAYDFKKLSQQLGYQNDQNFNASDDEISALTTYSDKSDTFYKDINSYLRSYPITQYDWFSVSPSQAQEAVKNLDGYFQKVPTLPKDLILYRGSTLKYRDNKSFQKGEVVIEKGYLSTSVKLDVAQYFSSGQTEESEDSDDQDSRDCTPESDRQALYLLYSEQPLKGILIDQDEDEVLLNHGLKLKIMNLIINGKHDYYLTQICGSTCKESAPTDLEKKFNLQFNKSVNSKNTVADKTTTPKKICAPKSNSSDNDNKEPTSTKAVANPFAH